MIEVREEEPLRSTAQQFVEFLESSIWSDIKGELEKWLEGVRDRMEIDTGEELIRNQGQANAMRFVIGLPEVLRDQLIEEQERKEREVKKDE